MTFPVTANLEIPVKVDIHLHSFYLGDRDRHCWTYVTRGMDAFDQHEMCLSLLIEDGDKPEDFPKTPVKMFELLAGRARDGKQVQSGDAIKLGQRGIFDFPCLFFVPAIQFPNLPELDEHLGLILVHDNEYAYARQYGLTRFLSRLGKFCSSFPYPTWNTQIRPSLFQDQWQEESLLAADNALMAAHSNVHMKALTTSERVLQLQLHKKDAEQVADLLAALKTDDRGLITTAFSPRCDASLYWQIGQTTPGAYAASEPGSGLVGGSFVEIRFGRKETFELLEDGFGLTLPVTCQPTLVDALRTGQAFEHQTEDLRFIVDALDTTARMRARDYSPAARWRTFDSPTAAMQDQTVEPERKTLLQRSPIKRNRVASTGNISDQVLEQYLIELTETLAVSLEEETDTFSFEVAIKIRANRAEVKVSELDMTLNPEFIAFIEELIGAKTPPAAHGQVIFSLSFLVNHPLMS